ncbi:MAG: PDZ domain-containing protein, partial [Lachnospiraceae bacterium]|nr:PDZ domain-containing protein [Lachnospiraceae bacterium]
MADKKIAFKGHVIKSIKEGGIAQEIGLAPGDRLLEINGRPIRDVFDYEYEMREEYVELTVEKSDGEQWICEVEKSYEEELGAEFENGLMDDYRSCSNRCIFCFIDQMPPGMRDTLYFKDDDSRLSFLQGNYITLTNMNQEELERVARYHFSPINVSVHTTDPQLRCQMLHNRFAGDVMEKMNFLARAGISKMKL